MDFIFPMRELYNCSLFGKLTLFALPDISPVKNKKMARISNF